MNKICVICGKNFTPSKYTEKRQFCCSHECNRQHNIFRARIKREENKDKTAMLRRQKTANNVICKICGKPTRQVDTNYVKSFHEECVLKDAIDTINSGCKISGVQYNRFYSFGYNMSDIKKIAQERKEEIQRNILTDDEIEELNSTIGYIIEEHTECENWEIEEAIRYTAENILKKLIKERERR